MNLQKEKVVPLLEMMGYTTITGTDVWKKQHEDSTKQIFWGVDFKKNEVFKWVEDHREYEVAGDKTFEELKILVAGQCGMDEPETESLPPEDNVPMQEDEPEEQPVQPMKLQPIRGIKGIVPQLCECGKIKIGKKGKVTQSRKGNSFRPPEKLDHFVVTTMQKTGEDDFETDKEIMSKLTDHCTEIPVMLMYDTPDLNFVTSLAYYDSAACQCRGDGERAIKADGTEIKCDPETCQYATCSPAKCKPNGVLSVVIMDAPRVGGVWKFRTTGWNSIRNLMSSIEFIYGLTGGRLAGLPLMLTLQPKSTVIPGTSTKTTIYMVNVEYRGTMAQLMSSANTRYVSEERMQALEAKASEQLALPESAEECKNVQEEFYPETMREL